MYLAIATTVLVACLVVKTTKSKIKYISKTVTQHRKESYKI